MRRRIYSGALAAISAACLALSGCAGYVDGFMGSEGATLPGIDGTAEPEETTAFEYLTGPITTSDALEDLKLLGRLADPEHFTILLTDDDEEMGSTSVRMEMHLGDSASVARFTDFWMSYGDLDITIPDFDLYMSGTSLYLSENAMTRSMILYQQVDLLTGLLAGAEGAEDAVADCMAMEKAIYEVIDATDKGRYIKLSSAEASAVPILLMTPVSSAMASGFFGNDISDVAALFEDKRDLFCRTEDGRHIFEVTNDTAADFYGALQGLDDGTVLGLVMIDSYDDPLWTSVTADNLDNYVAEIQSRIDAYRNHWKDITGAVGAGDLDYSFKLTTSIKSDTDIYLRLDMHTIVDGAAVDRSIEIATVEPEDVSLPSGTLIATPEQWEAEISPQLDTYLSDYIDKDEDSDE